MTTKRRLTSNQRRGGRERTCCTVANFTREIESEVRPFVILARSGLPLGRLKSRFDFYRMFMLIAVRSGLISREVYRQDLGQ